MNLAVLDELEAAYPSTDFVFLESGCGWLPYWLRRMDGHAEHWGHKLPRLRLRPWPQAWTATP